MGQILLTIPDDKISSFLSFIKNLDFVEKIEETPGYDNPLNESDWVKPGRPATDEEFKEMILDAENSEDLTLEEAKKLTKKHFDEWRQVTLK